MSKTKKEKLKIILPLIIIISVLIFIGIYGTAILNPTYDDWLLTGGDLSQHYIGWQAFRNCEWKFPFTFNTLTYPTDISIMFTDSNPLLEILFKLLSPILPDTFQYWGIYGLFSFVIMGVVAAIIINKYSKSFLFTIIGSVFFVISPTVLQWLYGHETLAGGQWLILLSISSLVFYSEVFSDKTRALLLWIVIAFLCVYTHLYFALFSLFILCGFCIYDYLEKKKITRCILYLLGYFSSLFISIWSLGGFSGGSSASDGFGLYSANLNTFINPQNQSNLLPSLSVYTSGQGEGSAYLGIGIIILFFITSFLFIAFRKKLLINHKKIYCYLAIAFVSFLFALSNQITLGDQLLLTIPLPEVIMKLCSIFRASGRAAWISLYLIFIYTICGLAVFTDKITSRKISSVILAACLLIQVVDLSKIWTRKISNSVKNTIGDFSNNEVMNLIGVDESVKHIYLLNDLSDDEYYKLGEYAVINDKTINRFNTVHGIGQDETDNSITDLLNSVEEDTVYISSKANRSIFYTSNLYLYDLGDFVLGTVDEQGGLVTIPKDELLNLDTSFTDKSGFQVINGTDDKANGIRTVYPGGTSFGPYIFLPAGTYSVEIDGNGLSGCSFAAYSSLGQRIWDLEIIKVIDEKILYSFTLTEDVTDMEFAIENTGENDIELSHISLTKIN